MRRMSVHCMLLRSVSLPGLKMWGRSWRPRKRKTSSLAKRCRQGLGELLADDIEPASINLLTNSLLAFHLPFFAATPDIATQIQHDTNNSLWSAQPAYPASNATSSPSTAAASAPPASNPQQTDPTSRPSRGGSSLAT
jgi:hypothetical protein